MAYCRNCGAYIPDGHTKCLACGLDQEQEEKSEYASAAQTREEEDSRRRAREEQQRKEEDRRRREEDRRWAEAERRRRQARREPPREDMQFYPEGDRPKGYQSNRLLAALSYIPALFILPFIFCSNDKFALYHARQGLILFAVTAAGQILGSAFGLGWIVGLMQIYWIIKGISNANAGRMEPLPYIGNLFFRDK